MISIADVNHVKKRCLVALFAALFGVSHLPCAGAAQAGDLTSSGTNHWAFEPITRPPVPGSVLGAARNRSAIDHFITANLLAHKLTAAPEADRRTLIRRLYFDLNGIPPSPEEVKKFVADKNPTAYENLVEKLLASPRYGECWARHWLDVVRFAESHGFEMNQPRPNAWGYRDYVIRALNEDKPYDQFVMEQLAGDVLGADEATGFLTGGSWDQVKSPEPVLTANQRADELHDMVSTTGSAFLGLTVGCARCHDHKFDPISQKEYYAIKASFEGVQHGERRLRTAETVAQEKELEQSCKRLEQIELSLEQLEPLANPSAPDTNAPRSAVNARKNIERFAPVLAKKVRFTVAKTTDAEPCLDELEIYTAQAAPRNIALATNGTKARASSVYPNSDIHRIEHINDGRHGNSHSWISNERGKGWIELEFSEATLINKIIWERDREQKFSDRLALEYRIEATAGSNDWQVIASSDDRQAYSPDPKKALAINLAGLTEKEARAAKAWIAERATLEARITELATPPMIYGGTFDAKPEPTYRLFRGDPTQKRETIPPGGLGAIPVKYVLAESAGHDGSERESKKLTDEQQRRLALAKWIVDAANPLTARVIVNRIWQYHFGEGLVSTSSDFGANGARPANRELLDWLAADFVEHRWSIKHFHRLIVTSAAYRQSSEARKDCLAVDAGSRFLWRFPPRRLEAEPIRDEILAVTGKLDLRMGGPGFSFFEANDNYVRVYTPRRDWPPETFRRMIYGTIIRQRPDGVFGAFDCPDAGQIAPERGSSVTPLQAFNLLNSSFMIQQAGFFAERLERECGKEPPAQARRAFALAFQRDADAEELAAAAKLIQQQGLNIFCRALLNANEFTRLD
jgi:hypothetical protein